MIGVLKEYQGCRVKEEGIVNRVWGLVNSIVEVVFDGGWE